MKKYILILFLVILIIPSIALASWWNPFSWKIFNKKTQISVVAPIIQNTSDEEIQKLKQEIEDLKKQKTNIPITTKSDNNETKKQIQTQIDSVLKDKAEQEALIAKQKIDEIKNIVTQPVSTQVTIQKPEIVDNSSPQRFFRKG